MNAQLFTLISSRARATRHDRTDPPKRTHMTPSFPPLLPLRPSHGPSPPHHTPHSSHPPKKTKQFGHLVLTTTFGIMDHEEARRRFTGGKVLGFFY